MNDSIDWRDSFPKFLRSPWLFRIAGIIAILIGLYLFLERSMVIGLYVFSLGMAFVVSSMKSRWVRAIFAIIGIGILTLLCYQTDII